MAVVSLCFERNGIGSARCYSSWINKGEAQVVMFLMFWAIHSISFCLNKKGVFQRKKAESSLSKRC